VPGRRKLALFFAPETLGHLDAIDRKYHRVIQRAIDAQLSGAPETETRNRKPLEQPAPHGAAWELRCGPRNRFRIFYEVDLTSQTVLVLAVVERNEIV
jgi:mRNA-degrading endonuclease RelE of RelBE toxin-antitoxin system